MSVVRRGVVAAALIPLVVLAGCTSAGDEPTAEPSATVTALADLATDDVAVVRGDFCARVSPQEVEEALGGAATDTTDATTWSNGDRARVADGVRDVVHEFGCAWTTDVNTARAWVFAPPVTGRQAHRLGRAAVRGDGCERVPDAERFGAHSLAVVCRAAGEATTTYHGLFGDAWLSCSLTGADLARTDRWCAAVLQAGRAA
ncbi:hypothetical protein [Nocardioides soli]|uniref:DUF3558 domain-containing protein n=1 Tax=Nocardioides soli TaxID=1036020 RepID=A0A7W4VT20_9ACTN|nr:hypothetical protein [Nocardioides soli]MBB3041130.1 hypothetical protein [Nocardioides soli]